VILAVRPSPFNQEPDAGSYPLSVVWMGHSSADDFNVIAHRALEPGGAEAFTYSLISDSNSLSADSTYEECAEAANRLMAKASTFLAPLNDRKDDNLDRQVVTFLAKFKQASWYACTKSEFLPSEESGREYSYWYGPARYEWNDPAWLSARKTKQRKVQAAIRKCVLDDEFMRQPKKRLVAEGFGFPAPLNSSVWALKKALHFTCYRLICKGEKRIERKTFEVVRDSILDAIDDIVRKRGEPRWDSNDSSIIPTGPSRPQNYICIIPGKFSLFSTVAHQVYLEMELRRLFCDTPSCGERKKLIAEVAERADELVARPTAIDLLGTGS